MRIAIVTPALVRNDGQGRVNLETTTLLLAQGHHITVLSETIAPDLLASANFRWVKIGLPWVPTSFARSQAFIVHSGWWLKKHAREFDVIHVNGSVTLYPSDVNSCHFVHHAWAQSESHTSRHNRNAYGLYHRLLTNLYCVQESLAYRRARHVVAVSGQVRDQLVASGVPESKISVIWNGIDINEFSPGTPSRERLGLPSDAFIMLFAGDMKTPRKNLDTILRAMTLVPKVHLVAAGKFRGQAYAKQVAALGLHGRVHFVGFRKDISDIMRAADTFIYPARYEPLGLVVLEALASGLPVITAKTTGASELIDASCGFVIADPNDCEALARGIAMISGDRHLRQTMGQAARQRALLHTWTNMAQQYVVLYNEIALPATSGRASQN